MSLPPSSAPTATGWSDSCRAGFAPAEEWRLRTAHQPRLSGAEAITNVAESFGILVYLLPHTDVGHQVHNVRAAFIAGLAHGMNKELLLLQQGDEPVPLDCRDLVKAFYHPDQIDEAIGDFAGRVTEAFQTTIEPRLRPATSILERVSLGASSAENELKDLAAYYLETDAYQRALRGDVRIIVGRKGSGKSAIFHRVRDRIRSIRSNIVLDLKPEGYKLLKFKEDVLRLLAGGTLEHTITAFWEYLLLLEICYKILDKDRIPHTRDQRLYEPYQQLAALYRTDVYVGEGDFSERMSVLLQHVSQEIQRRYPYEESGVRLSAPELTEILYVHDVAALRDRVVKYLKLKSSLWLLFDNVDSIRLAGDSSTNTGRNSRNGLGTLEVPNGNGAVNCIGSIGASPLRVTIPAWVGRS